MKDPKPHDNHLLGVLSPAVQGRLFPHVELIKLQLYARLDDSHRAVRHVYFPTHSVLTLQRSLEDGASAALAVVGKEGMVGITWILDEKSANYPAQVQSAGFAYRLHKSLVKEEFNRRGEFMVLTLRYIQALTIQVSQTASCNRHHSITQQFCRWLLISLDSAGGTQLTMSQEFISHMLGVRREGVSESAKKLQLLGVISYSRGLIKVIDRPKLEVMACECYRVVKNETDRLLGCPPQRSRFGGVSQK